MANDVMKTLTFATGLSTALLFVGFSTHTLAMSPFQANYQFTYNGKNLGSATRSLTQQSNNNWTYNFSAKAGAIASASETSKFNWSNGKLTSQQFTRTSKILVHNNTMNINFNPSTKMINTQKDDKSRSFAWQAGVLDELNAELQVREDLQGAGLKSTYPIADAKGIDTRRFVKQGTESVKTPYGTFNTIKVVIQHDKSEKSTIFWLAPKLDYLPVKVSHIDGKTSYGLLLTKYSGKSS